MPQDLPGFYYDAEKNRYFPNKSPIPGSTPRSRSSASSSLERTPTKSVQAKNAQMGMLAKMLHDRELCGNTIISNKRKVKFQEQYQKIRASKPIIWKYRGTQRIADAALEHTFIHIQTPGGLTEAEILLAGCRNGSLCLYAVGNDAHLANYGMGCMPDLVHPLQMEEQATSLKSPGLLWSPRGALIQTLSDVSCIKMPKSYRQAINIASTKSLALITTLGSETSGGSVYLMNLSEPLESAPSVAMMSRRIDEISIFNSTIWTADCNSDVSRAVIGTNIGASLVHTESGRRSWLCRSTSDVLSLQFDYSGNIVLCGLRNGAIVTVDTRQKPEELSAKLRRHQIPYPSHKTSGSSRERDKAHGKKWFELKGNVRHSQMIFMPSSVCCLATLQLYDQYFLASSMDGTMKLYDHRMAQRGAVQLYEGNVNSHTRVQLGVDPSERFVISGGEDFYLRAWSIKSGELLYEDKFMNSVPSVVCWPRGQQDDASRGISCKDNHFPGVWLGSQEGLFYVHNS